MQQNTIILIIFAVTYLGIAMGRIPGLKLNRPGIALLGAIAMMLLGGVTTAEAVSYINWPTICLLFGFFVISAQLRLSGFYDVIAVNLANQLSHPARFLLILMLAAAGLSAFLNNDVVCLVFAPITGVALLRKNINPVPFLIALAIASNLGAAATVIGNPQNMMISQVARLGFGSYLVWSIAPVLFALGAAYGIIWLMSHNHLHLAGAAQSAPPQQAYPYNRIHTVKGMIILIAVIGLFFTPLPKEIIALAAAGIHLASTKFRTEDLLGLVDWPILVLFMGLFVVTGAFQSTGYGLDAVHWMARGGYNLNAPVTLVLTTAAMSNLIGNSAAVMLLLKITDIAQHSVPYVLALSNSFGGNLIIIGAVSNIIVAQQAREMEIKIGFWDFARLGIPVTLVALAALVARVLLN
ncbi:MAG TPA: SLC13 family permease [Candidatus Sulfotelmatobacter sp.]|nr:SLC13 family permease [Candidatus Sulfotelmatobacter sp.]